jgi:hypothetical protein
MTVRVNKVIEQLAALSPTEMAEVVTKFRQLCWADDNARRVCSYGDLLRFLEGHAVHPEFADEIAASIGERRTRMAGRTSRWDR